ncbi:MAG: hypothetical protein AB3N11_01820, partial [Arenibacterium sp.]
LTEDQRQPVTAQDFTNLFYSSPKPVRIDLLDRSFLGLLFRLDFKLGSQVRGQEQQAARQMYERLSKRMDALFSPSIMTRDNEREKLWSDVIIKRWDKPFARSN